MRKRKHLRRIGISLFVLLLSVTILCLLNASPSSTAEMAFRRKEKQNLIGPAEIIATLDFPHGSYDHILIGESDFGYTFFECHDNGRWDQGDMTYVPRKEGATLYCTYHMYGSAEYSADWLPIFAFADHHAAVRAKLTLTTTQNGETVNYPLEAQRSHDGFFLFSLKTMELRAQDFWLIQQTIANQYREYVLDGTAQATLELYDANGELLETYQFTK